MDMTTLSAKVTNSYHVIDLQFLPSDNYNKNCNIHNRKKRHKCASKSRGDKAYSVHPVPKSRGDLSLCPPYDRRPWEQDPGATARLRKLYGTKSSVGGGASGAHPAYTWKRGQIWGCAQRGVRQCAGPCLGTVTAQLGGQHKVSCSNLVEL